MQLSRYFFSPLTPVGTITIAVALLLIEAAVMSALVDAATIRSTFSNSVSFNVSFLQWLLSSMGILLQWAIVTLTMGGILWFLFYRSASVHTTSSSNTSILTFSTRMLFLHGVCYGACLWLSLLLFVPRESTPLFLALSWLIFIGLTFFSWFFCFFTYKSACVFVKHYYFLCVGAALSAVFIMLLISVADELWRPLSVITLYGAAWLLSLFYTQVLVDAPEKWLGVNDFVVSIAPECAGLEGVVIVSVTTLLYLYGLRKVLSFPTAFLLLPIAVLLSIICNILRIFLLLVVGDVVSADLAIGGFHSAAGWIMAACVTALVIFLFSSNSYFYKDKPLERDAIKAPIVDDSALATAILIPFIGSLGASLIIMSLSSNVSNLYPYKMLVGLLLLLYFWSSYNIAWTKRWFEPAVVGVFMGALWLVLVPSDESAITTLPSSGYPSSLLLIWLVARGLGFIVVTPIIEELVFRGYILAKLSKTSICLNGHIPYSIVAIVASSFIFGAMHDAYIAGFICGVLYSVLRYRSESIMSPILAHAVTNAMLFIVEVSSL